MSRCREGVSSGFYLLVIGQSSCGTPLDMVDHPAEAFVAGAADLLSLSGAITAVRPFGAIERAMASTELLGSVATVHADPFHAVRLLRLSWLKFIRMGCPTVPHATEHQEHVLAVTSGAAIPCPTLCFIGWSKDDLKTFGCVLWLRPVELRTTVMAALLGLIDAEAVRDEMHKNTGTLIGAFQQWSSEPGLPRVAVGTAFRCHRATLSIGASTG